MILFFDVILTQPLHMDSTTLQKDCRVVVLRLLGERALLFGALANVCERRASRCQAAGDACE